MSKKVFIDTVMGLFLKLPVKIFCKVLKPNKGMISLNSI